MDMNEYMGGGVPYAGFPLGAGLVFTDNDFSSQGYEDLTETEKEHLILKCKDAKTTEAKQKIVDSIISDTDVKALAEEEAVDNSYKDSMK